VSPKEDLDDLGARRAARPECRGAASGLAPEPAPGGEAVIAALESERILANGKDPRRFAELYLDECRFHDDPIIARWGGSWWRYEIDMGAYRELSVEEFRRPTCGAFSIALTSRRPTRRATRSSRGSSSSRNLVSNVVDALTSVAPFIVGDAPQWIRQDYRDNPDPQTWRPAPTVFWTSRTASSSRGRHGCFATSSIGTVWRSEPQPCPEWLKFLDSLWGDDKESIQALREMFRIPAHARTRACRRSFALIGPPRCGKGTSRAAF